MTNLQKAAAASVLCALLLSACTPADSGAGSLAASDSPAPAGTASSAPAESASGARLVRQSPPPQSRIREAWPLPQPARRWNRQSYPMPVRRVPPPPRTEAARPTATPRPPPMSPPRRCRTAILFPARRLKSCCETPGRKPTYTANPSGWSGRWGMAGRPCPSGEDTAFESIGILLLPGGENRQSYPLDCFAQPLTPGTYRLSMGMTDYTVGCTFRLE